MIELIHRKLWAISKAPNLDSTNHCPQTQLVGLRKLDMSIRRANFNRPPTTKNPKKWPRSWSCHTIFENRHSLGNKPLRMQVLTLERYPQMSPNHSFPIMSMHSKRRRTHKKWPAAREIHLDREPSIQMRNKVAQVCQIINDPPKEIPRGQMSFKNTNPNTKLQMKYKRDHLLQILLPKSS